jgi:3-phenylpropionate/trans-cinnamate dioxygenase ferredoxin subunit
MTEFVSLATAAEVSPGTMRVFEHSGREIVIANLGGGYFAFSNKCTCVAHFAAHVEGATGDGHHHVGDFGHLIEGELTGDTVSCPLHTTVYDVKTGGPLKGPGEIPLSTFEVKLDGDRLSVAVMADSERHFWNDPGGAARP